MPSGSVAPVFETPVDEQIGRGASAFEASFASWGASARRVGPGASTCRVVRSGIGPDAARVGYRDAELRAWLEKAGSHLLEHLVTGARREDSVLAYTPPGLAHEIFDAHVGLKIGPDAPPYPPEQLLTAIDDVIARSVNAGHPRFFNQNWAGADPVAVLGDWLTSLLNTTVATYEMAPLFTLMENEVLGRLSQLAGFSKDDGKPRLQPGAHGLFVPGGALSNQYALHIARTWADPEATEEGLFGRTPLVAFTSAQSHYSLSKATRMLGMGKKACVSVACDAWGRMRVDALEAAIAEARAAGLRPFFVNATAGTTVAGAFDPIDAIADVADRENLWLHVDGCYGGTALFSKRHRGLLDGLERARTFAWNPHKMMGITQQCAVLLVREGARLRSAFASDADYLFQNDKNDADMDLGDLTLQCGRRSDGVKLWLTWKARGEAWFEDRLDHAVSQAEALEAKVRDDPRFCLAVPRSFANVGFWWVPPDLRPLDPKAMSEEVKARLHKLAPAIKDAMQREGSAMLGYQPLGGRPNFFRLLIMSPEVTAADVDTTLEIINRLGERVEAARRVERPQEA